MDDHALLRSSVRTRIRSSSPAPITVTSRHPHEINLVSFPTITPPLPSPLDRSLPTNSLSLQLCLPLMSPFLWDSHCLAPGSWSSDALFVSCVVLLSSSHRYLNFPRRLRRIVWNSISPLSVSSIHSPLPLDSRWLDNSPGRQYLASIGTPITFRLVGEVSPSGTVFTNALGLPARKVTLTVTPVAVAEVTRWQRLAREVNALDCTSVTFMAHSRTLMRSVITGAGGCVCAHTNCCSVSPTQLQVCSFCMLPNSLRLLHPQPSLFSACFDASAGLAPYDSLPPYSVTRLACGDVVAADVFLVRSLPPVCLRTLPDCSRLSPRLSLELRAVSLLRKGPPLLHYDVDF